MPFELHTLGGRHLVFAYAAVLLIQGGYCYWVSREWLKTKPFAAKKITETSQ
jgi:hypothetical protein